MTINSINPEVKAQIISILQSVSRLTNLDICFYTYAHRDLIPYELQIHSDPVCMQIKETQSDACVAHCGCGIPQKIFEFENGKIDTCPFGCSQIIIPVATNNHLLGVIFAGVFQLKPNQIKSKQITTAKAKIKTAPSAEWLEDQKNMIFMLSKTLENILTSANQNKPSIENKILQYIMQNISEPKKLTELARVIQKSPSRTSHLVREHFNASFQQLLNDVRINQATTMLSQTNYTIAQIAIELGFSDQSHFTHCFKKRLKITPLKYRKQNFYSF